MSEKALFTVRAMIVRTNPNSKQLEVYLQQKSSKLWELPGGKIDPGQTPLDAIQREVSEEANIAFLPSQLQYKGSCEYSNPKNRIQTKIDFFSTEIKYEISKKMTHEKSDQQEDKLIDFAWISLSNFVKYTQDLGYTLQIKGEKAELSGNTTNLSTEVKIWIKDQFLVNTELLNEQSKSFSRSFITFK